MAIQSAWKKNISLKAQVEIYQSLITGPQQRLFLKKWVEVQQTLDSCPVSMDDLSHLTNAEVKRMRARGLINAD